MTICQEIGAYCIDLARNLELGDSDYCDGLHYTPAGAKKIGDFLYSRNAPIL